MKILQVSHRVPYPLNEGGTIGIYNYTRGFYEAGHEVTLITLHGLKHVMDMEETQKELSKYCKLFIFDIDTSVKPLGALLNLFTNKSYNTSRFEDKKFELFLKETLQKNSYDIIQVEGTFVAMYHEVLRKHSTAPIVLRQHNVEFQIWERLATHQNNPLKKWYLKLLAKRLKTFEQSHLQLFDAIIPVTEDDAKIFKSIGCEKPMFVSPAGIDTNYWKPSAQPVNPFHIFHLGSLEWMPNQEAVLWFIEKVWPKIRAIDQRFKLFIAGKNMPEFIKNMNVEGVNMVGEVKDGADFINDKNITVVPLLSGSGIRLKILEAMAAEKLVVSTTIGAQGIEYKNGKNILIADSPEEFVQIFQKIAQDPESFKSIQQNGHQLILNKYANSAVIKRLIHYYDDLLNKN